MHRPQNQGKFRPRLHGHEARLGLSGRAHLPGARHHHDLLHRHRRLDPEVHDRLCERQRTLRRPGRLLRQVHHLAGCAARLHADLSGADRLYRLQRRGKGHRTLLAPYHADPDTRDHGHLVLCADAFLHRRQRRHPHRHAGAGQIPDPQLRRADRAGLPADSHGRHEPALLLLKHRHGHHDHLRLLREG